MKLLVTGGAGFIGSNYVRSLLQTELGKETTRITVLDLLTYAGNLANLEPIENDSRYTFVRGDINDGALVDELQSPTADSVIDRMKRFGA